MSSFIYYNNVFYPFFKYLLTDDVLPRYTPYGIDPLYSDQCSEVINNNIITFFVCSDVVYTIVISEASGVSSCRSVGVYTLGNISIDYFNVIEINKTISKKSCKYSVCPPIVIKYILYVIIEMIDKYNITHIGFDLNDINFPTYNGLFKNTKLIRKLNTMGLEVYIADNKINIKRK